MSVHHHWNRLRGVLGGVGRPSCVLPATPPSMFETLEQRCLMSCSVFVDNGVLVITGDEADNAVVINDHGAQVAVACDGEQIGLFAGIERVQVRTDGGQDTVHVNLLGPDGGGDGEGQDRPDIELPGRLYQIGTGAGNDAVVLSASPGTGPADTALGRRAFEINTGGGDDHVRADLIGRRGGVAVRADLGVGDDTFAGRIGAHTEIQIQGAAGDDHARLHVAPHGGAVVVSFDGGLGDDALAVVVGGNTIGDAGLLGGALAIHFQGGAGHDSLGVHLEGAAPDRLAIHADLGQGNDRFAFNAEHGLHNRDRDAAPHTHIHVNGGEGHDDVGLHFGGVVEDLHLTADLGDGHDRFVLDAQEGYWGGRGEGDTANTSRPDIVVLGGQGHDQIAAHIGPVRGDLAMVLDGQAGNDTIAARLRMTEHTGAVRAAVLGGPGDDLLSLIALGDPRITPWLLVDGGVGFDRAWVTPNVRVVNTEVVHEVE